MQVQGAWEHRGNGGWDREEEEEQERGLVMTLMAQAYMGHNS